MLRSGHVGVTLLCYTPLIAASGRYAEWLLPLTIIGAVLLVDLLLPITLVLTAVTSGTWTGRYAFTLAMLPDLDTRLPGVSHRGATHSVWFAAGVALVFGVLGSLVVPLGEGLLVPREMNAARVGGLFFGYLGLHVVLTHVLTDALTPMGIRPFAPVSNRQYGVGLVRAGNSLANYSCYALGVGATLITVASSLQLV